MRCAPRWASTILPARALAVALLMACAGMPLAGVGCRSGDPKENLRERATEYLELKRKRDWTAIYQGLLDPETRKTVKLEDFLKPRNQAMDLLGYELVSTEINEEGGSVKAKVDVVIPILSPRGGTTMMRKELEDSQHWVQRDGRWYIQLRG